MGIKHSNDGDESITYSDVDAGEHIISISQAHCRSPSRWQFAIHGKHEVLPAIGVFNILTA